MKTMIDLEEFYILGLPIKTDLGNCHFLKVKEYPEYFMDLQIISLTKLHIINKFKEINKNGELDEFILELEKADLFDIVRGIPELRESYNRFFDKVYQDINVFFKIQEKEMFEYQRSLVMRMNAIREEKINPNPEIQKAIERSRRLNAQSSGELKFVDIVTSIVGYNGLTYADINEFTIYQLYMTYYRIAQIKNYDTSTLFATVASDKIEIESWSKHIDLFEEDYGLTKEEFSKTAKLIRE